MKAFSIVIEWFLLMDSCVSVCVCLARWAERLDALTSTATQDPEGFLGHPVNAFKLMKRLNTEWGELENLVLTDMSDGQQHSGYQDTHRQTY